MGALLHYSCRRGSYCSGGGTNRGGRSNRGSTVSLEIHKSLLSSYRRKMSSTDYFSVMFVNSGPKFPIWTYKTITKSNNIFILHKNIFRKNMVFVRILWALYYFSNVLLAGLTAAFPNTSTTNAMQCQKSRKEVSWLSFDNLQYKDSIIKMILRQPSRKWHQDLFQ